MRYYLRQKEDHTEIALDGGEVVARFPRSEDGRVALQMFVYGLAARKGYSLYDEGADLYIVGTLDDLCAGEKLDQLPARADG